MNDLLGTLPVGSAEDVASVRQQVMRVAELLGLDRQGQTRLATAVSEIARNAVVHAGGGEVHLSLDASGKPGRFVVAICDHGPGIAELDDVLTGRKVFAPGRGAGLASARRLVDEFDVASTSDGTIVRLGQRQSRQASVPLSESSRRAIALVISRRSSDPLTALREQDRQLIDSLTELQDRQVETTRLNRELDETNRGVVALYSELEQKADQLRLASDMKSRFLSHMSHEFRTPLNSILALTRLLLDRVDGDLTGEQHRQIDYVRKAAQGLLEMVNDLLDLAKVEAGRLEIKASTFTVDSLFASLRGALKPLLVNASVELSFDVQPGMPEIHADEQKLSQVLRNLVSNALKFTEEGHVHVLATHDAARSRVVFQVEDTGVGIAPADQERIFEEFGQIDGRLQKGGTGLGLPLSRRLTLLMGGDLTVRSEQNQGSTFEFFLPVRYGQIGRSSSGGGRKLLVVDDEEAFRYVVSHIAADAGFEVEEAANGEEGLKAMQARRPDAVVLDLNMPVMDGFALLAQMDSPDLAGLPVIVCTSQVLQMDQKRMLARAYAIVPKHDISREGLTRLFRSAVNAPDEGASS